ncbi:MAG: ParB/RepB/Spo0J family partition protein [Candidatus Buchananbacteria bacterium]
MTNKLSGLGRGLGSLIPNKKLASMSFDDDSIMAEVVGKRESVVEIDVQKIVPNPYQPRMDFSEESLNDLSESIKEHGIIQPLIVVKNGPDEWQLIAGERRWRCAKNLGLKTVPVIVRDMTDQKKMEIALIENLQRQNLNALEVAIAYQKLLDEFNMSIDQLAQKVGKNRSTINNTLRLLTAREEVHQAIRDGKISEGHARVLAGLPEEDQLDVLQKILDGTMSVRDTEKTGREIVIKKKLRTLIKDPELTVKEEELEKLLNTRVDIKGSTKAGQIIIKYFSNEEFNEILKKIG